MALILIGSQTSPFVRKLRIYLNEQKTPYEFKEINIFEQEGAEYLKKINPINKIPVLIDGENIVWDSRVIFNYLNKDRTPLTIAEENILSAIDSAIDANVVRLLSKRSHLDIDGDYMIFKRNKLRTDQILDFLKPTLKNYAVSKKFDFISISLFCFLDWVTFRVLHDLSGRSEIVDFMNAFKDLPSIKQTEIPETLK